MEHSLRIRGFGRERNSTCGDIRDGQQQWIAYNWELLAAGVLLLWVYWLKSADNRKANLINQFPGPKALPIIGNGHQMLFKPTDYYKWSWGLCKKWGDPMKVWFFNRTFFFVSSYDVAIQLLTKSNFNARNEDIQSLFWKQSGGNGISSIPAHMHHARRKLLQPGFSRQIAERSVAIFVEESKKLVDKLKPFAETGETFNVMQYLMPCAFRVICKSAFGDYLEKKTDSEAMEYMRALHIIALNTSNRVMTPFLWLKNDFIYYNLTQEGRKTREAIKIVNGFGLDALNKIREERKRNEWQDVEPERLPSYAEKLLELCEKGELKEDGLLGELNNYIVAGYDTTALSVAWTLFALALSDQSHQDKAFKEVNDIFGVDVPTRHAALSAADTKRMKYLEMCIKEGLRLYPTIPALPRAAVYDMKLKDGRVIPANTDVFIMIDLIHRDPKYFPKPDQFIPERHLEHIPAIMPFSAGVRNCIGQVFGKLHVTVELAFLLREYIWETEDTPETLPCVFQGLFVPQRGINFRIRKRTSNPF